MNKIWDVQSQPDEYTEQLACALTISSVTARVLINRGLTDCIEAEQFFHPSLHSLHDPFLMQDMSAAVTTIQQAIALHERILVWGDYDVDGITATTLMVTVLRQLGAEVDYHIPNRFDDGYGLHEEVVAIACDCGAKLVITVDCGVSGHAAAIALREAGLKLVITDHHTVPETMPIAAAVIDPHRLDCCYPFTELAGVGVAFKLAQALCGSETEGCDELLDLVALGTIADIVPLVGENRVLVAHGLACLSRGDRLGVRMLREAAKLKAENISAQHVGFVLGPRINAAGRVGLSRMGCDLLLSNDLEQARTYAEELNTANRTRQQIEGGIVKEAVKRIDEYFDPDKDRVIVVHDESWHQGVVGIVAARLVDRYFRPAIVLTTAGDKAKGSGRSIPRFHLFDAIKACESLLTEFGGHKHAVGLSLPLEHIAAFREQLQRGAEAVLQPHDLIQHIKADCDIALSAISMKLIEELDHLEPFGMGNPKPVFASLQVKLKSPPRRIGQKGYKAWVTDGARVFEAVDFSGTTGLGNIGAGEYGDLLYTMGVNTWNGTSSINLYLKDVRRSKMP